MTDSDSLTWDLIRLGSLHTPMAVRVAATLRLCDHVEAGADTVADLAAVTETDPRTLLRLMRHLVAINILAVDETSTRYTVTDLGNVLTDGHFAAQRLWHDLNEVIARADVGFMSLLDAVRTGDETYSKTYGQPFYDDLTEHPELRQSFDELFSFDEDVAFEAPTGAVDWSAVSTVMDVGGGTGGFISSIAQRHPTIAFTLFDLPAVVDKTSRTMTADGLTSRITFVPGDFREWLPAGFDIVILSFVLNGCPDDQARDLLIRCRESLNDKGRILVFEREDTAAASYNERFTELDLRMLVFLGGRLRLREEWEQFAASAGLRLSHSHRLDNPSVPFDLSLLELESTSGAYS